MTNSPPAAIAYRKGYVTTFSAIAGKSSSELERLLGFNSGALAQGYELYELMAPVAPGEFEWADQTTYSDGWHFDRSSNEYVQRRDQRRWHFYRQSNWDAAAADREDDRFMAEQLRRLNVRHGPERIVKLVPKVRVSSFPDSPYRGVRQWKLTVEKPFRRISRT